MNTCILLLGSVVVIVFCRTALPVECLSLFRVLTYSGNDRGCLEQPTTCKSLARVFQKGLSSPFYSFLLVPVCCCWSQFDCSWQWIQNYVTIFYFVCLRFIYCPCCVIIIIISGFGIYGAAVVPDSGAGNTWQRLTLVLHEFLSNGLTPSRLHIVISFLTHSLIIFNTEISYSILH